MPVECIIDDPRWKALSGLAEKAHQATLQHLGLDPAQFEVSVLGCDDARIAALNADFRGKPRPTNVLSWPSAERAAAHDGQGPAAPDADADPALGDIAIAYDTCAAEAAAAGKPLADHALHLLVHGILHLLGYDHERPADAALMEGLEVEILGNLGLADPYNGDRGPLAPV